MNTVIDGLTEEQFHETIHKDIDKPVQNFRKKIIHSKYRHIKVHTGAHKVSWADATIFSKQKLINIQVYLNFKQNDLNDSDYEKLKGLAVEGIGQYWSRNIKSSGSQYMVRVQAHHRTANAIPVDLYIESDQNQYGRSMNPAMLGIDASFIYNKGYLGNLKRADSDFKLIAAHEFGHSVLMHAGGLPLSWGHKGSTNPLTQSVKSSTPGYPNGAPIDLMKYYDGEKYGADFRTRINNTVAMEIDIKRLIWGAKIQWKK